MENYLAVKVEETDKTKSGILLAGTAEKPKPQQGVITHVGDVANEGQSATWTLTKNINDRIVITENIFKVGQVILFEKYGAIELKVDDEVLSVIDKRDVIGILE